MPIELQERQKKLSTNWKIILFAIAAAVVALWLSQVSAAEADDMLDHMLMDNAEFAPTLPGPPQPGDYGYEHMRFHERIYSQLRRLNGGSCCSGDECRVTEPLRPASDVFKAAGYDYLVKIDRRWYPVNLKEKLAIFTPEQQKLAKTDPLWREFLSLTHVCASRSGTFLPSFSETVPGIASIFPQGSDPSIYCIVDGGDRT